VVLSLFPNVGIQASADFTITAPQVNAPHYVLIQATYGTTGSTLQSCLKSLQDHPAFRPCWRWA